MLSLAIALQALGILMQLAGFGWISVGYARTWKQYGRGDLVPWVAEALRLARRFSWRRPATVASAEVGAKVLIAGSVAGAQPIASLKTDRERIQWLIGRVHNLERTLEAERRARESATGLVRQQLSEVAESLKMHASDVKDDIYNAAVDGLRYQYVGGWTMMLGAALLVGGSVLSIFA